MNIFKPKITINDRKYIVQNQIGEGAYAYVYRVKQATDVLESRRVITAEGRNSGYYAIKKVICQTGEQIEQIRKEIDILSLLRHENVIPLLGSSFATVKKGSLTFQEVFLLMPIYQGNVQGLIDKGKGFPNSIFDENILLQVLKGCCAGLIAIHRHGYRHNDFKPANILLDESFRAVITDFGSATDLRTDIKSRSDALRVQEEAEVNTTASYRSPELFNPPSLCVIDGKCDVWSFGCAMYAMMFSRSPFESSKQGLSTLALQSGQYSIPDSKWPKDFIYIVKKCLQVDCNFRFSIDELSELIDQLKIGTAKSSSAQILDSVDQINQLPPIISSSVSADEQLVSDDEFGDFESAPMPEKHSEEKSVQLENCTVRTIFATILRPKGITRQSVVKPCCMIVYVGEQLIVRKYIDPDSKVYAIVSLTKPRTVKQVTPSTEALGEYQLEISGSFLTVPRARVRSFSSNINQRLSWNTEKSSADSVNEEQTDTEYYESSIIAGFSSHNELSDALSILV